MVDQRRKLEEAPSRSSPRPAAPAVTVAGVDYAFGKGDARKQVLFDIELEIEPGELIILTGPSGAGKTTLLTLIGALRSLQSGSIRVLGNDLAGLSMRRLNALRRHIGFIFQDHNLFDALTVRQTLIIAMKLFASEYTRRDFDSRPPEMLAALDMTKYLDAKPRSLSTGQKQRIAIARALINSPRLILADEPTASLDAGAGDDVLQLLERATRETDATVIMVTHDARNFAVADRVLEMADGRVSGETRYDL